MKTKLLVVLLVLAVVMPALCSRLYSAPATYSFKCEDVNDPKIDPNVYGEVKVKKVNADGVVTNIFTYADSCKSDTTVFDKYCIKPNSGTPGGRYLNCKPGEKCESGKCISVQPAASLAEVTDQAWIPAAMMNGEYFTCEQSGFFVGFKVKGVFVYDCGGDGQIDYANKPNPDNAGWVNPNSPDGWLPQDQFAQYQLYLNLVISKTKERLAAVVSNLGGINYVNADALGFSAGFLLPGSMCPPNTVFYMNFGGSESVAISCQGPASNCKMFNMGLDMNGAKGKATPFVVQGWDKFWDEVPANYPQDAVTIMNELIDNLPEKISAECNGEELNINFVK